MRVLVGLLPLLQPLTIHSSIYYHKRVFRVKLTLLNLLNLLILPCHYFRVILSRNTTKRILMQLHQVAKLIQVIIRLIGLRNVHRKPEHIHRLDILPTESKRLGSLEIELLVFLHHQLI